MFTLLQAIWRQRSKEKFPDQRSNGNLEMQPNGPVKVVASPQLSERHIGDEISAPIPHKNYSNVVIAPLSPSLCVSKLKIMVLLVGVDVHEAIEWEPGP